MARPLKDDARLKKRYRWILRMARLAGVDLTGHGRRMIRYHLQENPSYLPPWCPVSVNPSTGEEKVALETAARSGGRTTDQLRAAA